MDHLEKMKNIWNIIHSYNIKIKNEDLKNLKCVICENLLKDARVAPCLCRYCRKCLETYLENGNKFCYVCPLKMLPNIVKFSPDYSADEIICKMIVKCPEESCSHHCELEKISEHLRVCQNQGSFCPFKELGCEEINISKNQMIDHLHMDDEIHSKLLINLVNNLTNEMKRIQEIYEKKFNNLQKEFKDKDKQIENLRKLNHEVLLIQIQEIQDENKLIKSLNNEIQVENEIIKFESIKTKQLTEDLEIKVKLAELKLSSNLGMLVWKIDELSHKRKNNKIISSDYFYSPDGHRMILYFYPNGSRTNLFTDQISFSLFMSSFQCNNSHSFKGDVIIEIFEQNTVKAIHSISKHCEVKKGYCGDSFDFPYNVSRNVIMSRCCLSK